MELSLRLSMCPRRCDAAGNPAPPVILLSVSQPSPSGPISIPPPRPVAVAAALLCGEALGVVVLAVVIVASGLKNSAAIGQLLAQGAYYVILAAGMLVCGWALLKGRRWGRTPTIVVQIVLAAVGYWMAVPSGRLLLGIALIVLAVITGGLLLSKPANDWVSRFPSLFGPEPGQ